MKHLRLLSLLLLLMAHQVLWAGPRTYRQAQAIAEKLAEQMGVSITPEAKARSFSGAATSVSPIDASSGGSAINGVSASAVSSAYFVFPYGEDRGYAIVSGDDQMPEIVAYSDKGTFDEASMSDGCRAYLAAYKQVADAVAKGDKSALKVMAEKRALLAAANYQQPAVSPLLGDIQWNQDMPYNNMCPMNQDLQKRCYTGCVATAMAQVMRYWQYPESLLADIPAYTSYDKQISSERYEMPQIDKGVKYDWASMLPTYSSSSGGYTQQQADAVATLMLHCGAAVKMAYSTDGSGANIDPEIFVNYFGYDPDMLCMVTRDAFSLKDWCKLIDNELLAKRPVLYAGSSTEVGHQFVCDGADGKGFYHINWGWGGNSDGYYDIAILSPNERGIGAGTGLNGYNRFVDMVIGLQPDNGIKDEPLVTMGELVSVSDGRSLTITQADRSSVAGKFKLIYTAAFANFNTKPFSALVNVGIKDEQGHYQPIANAQSLNLPAHAGVGSIETTIVAHTFRYAFPVGTTELYDIYSTDGGKTWQQCYPYWGLRPLEVVATDTHLAIVDETKNLQATVQATGDVEFRQNSQFSYTVSNANKHDYLGEVYIYSSHDNTLPANPSFADYVDIEAGGSTTHSFTLVPKDLGDLYIWVYDVQGKKMLVEAQKFTVKENENFRFRLLSKSINVKEGEYERERAYMYANRVAMPVIDGDEAVVKYELKNNGPTYSGSLPLSVYTYAADDIGFLKVDKTCTLEGNGGITQLEYRFKASDLGEYTSFSCQLERSALGEVDYSLIDEFWLLLVDQPGYGYPITKDELAGYFDTGSTAIAAAPTVIDGLQVSAGKGVLNIWASKAQTVGIYSLSGQKIRSLAVKAGTTTSVNLPVGIYVIGKQKVMVK